VNNNFRKRKDKKDWQKFNRKLRKRYKKVRKLHTRLKVNGDIRYLLKQKLTKKSKNISKARDKSKRNRYK
jgi:hypothetical protein